MSLLYYIMLRAGGIQSKGKVLFWAIQSIWFILIPLFLLEMPAINMKINKEYRMEVVIFAQISIFVYDFFFYFREINENKFLIRYTNKYKVVENHPNLLFNLIYLFLIFLGLYVCTLIPGNFKKL